MATYPDSKHGCGSFNKDVEVTSHHGNIKDKQFGVAYMKQFDLVFNALDNVGSCKTVPLPQRFS